MQSSHNIVYDDDGDDDDEFEGDAILKAFWLIGGDGIDEGCARSHHHTALALTSMTGGRCKTL